MYEQFYGFSEKPFSLTPDPSFLYLGSKHSMGLAMLRYGLMNHAGISVLTGEIGSGKTTLLRYLIGESDEGLTIGLISNTHEAFGSLMEWIAVAFGLEASSSSRAALYDEFTQFLIAQFAAGRRTVLIVDEAQNLSTSTLEELRLLTNINADKDQPLQLILVGQPELRQKLRNPSLIQFVQRIAVDYHLAPLEAQETSQYIAHRLESAGGDPSLFSRAACRFIHYQTGGVPRLINSLCDTALVYGFAGNAAAIEADLVYDLVLERIDAGLFGAGVASLGVHGDGSDEGHNSALKKARSQVTAYFDQACEESASDSSAKIAGNTNGPESNA